MLKDAHLVYNAGVEDRDILLRKQSISTLCNCRWLLLAGYHAATFSTDPVVTCSKCTDNKEVISSIESILKKLKHEWYEEALEQNGPGIKYAAGATNEVAVARCSR